MAVTPLTVRDDIKLILSTGLSDLQIDQFILDASLWVGEELLGKGLSDDRVELITRYLTAALIRLRDLGMTSVQLDDVRENYQVDPEVTEYLKRAAAMDPTSTVQDAFLPEIEGRKRAVFRVGKGFGE